MSYRIAYLLNQYPKISHTFIRREILALEQQGFEVLRIALRGWDDDLVDEADQQERLRTRYVLRQGSLHLLRLLLWTALRRPIQFLRALGVARKVGWRADRPLAYHLIYLAEACCILPYLQSFGAKHIHAHFGTNAAEVAMLVGVLGGSSYSFTVHGPEEFDKPEFLGIRDKIERAAFVVAITSFARSQLYRWVSEDNWRKVQVVHCGLESSFSEGPISPPANAPRLVCVGRLAPEKGHLLLIDAATKLVETQPNFRIVIVGGGQLRKALELSIAQRGLEQHVELAGAIPTSQLRREILSARALVLPSFAEGLPMTIMEAMSLGRPVITTYVGGIPELVRHGENGWLVPAGSVSALVSALEDCLSLPLDHLQAMGERGRCLVLKRHSADIQAARLATLFRNSIRQHQDT